MDCEAAAASSAFDLAEAEIAFRPKALRATVKTARCALRLIFEKFLRGDSSEQRHFEGAGLGLFIVKGFTELLGGEVSVESEVGRGSTFCVTLPCGEFDVTINRDDRDEPATL